MTEINLVCMRLTDLRVPTVPSFRDTCVDCGQEVWRSNRSSGLVAVVFCTRCAEVRIVAADDPIVEIAPYVNEDVRLN